MPGHRFVGIEYYEKLLYSMAPNSKLFGTGLTRFNEKQLYKKFLKVIEVPPLARLDTSLMEDFRFYARFLEIYVIKMKKDWVKKYESFFGEGLKERREKQKDVQFKKDWANYKKRIEDEKKFIEIREPGLDRDFYDKEVSWQATKKRKKSFKKLWRNTIPLTLYRGTLEVSYEFVKRRRKEREKEEIFLFNPFGYYYAKKEKEPIIKDFNKAFYSEPREGRSESEDCECEAETINHQSNVVMIRLAAETEVSNKNT
jgi:hypothetical protein